MFSDSTCTRVLLDFGFFFIVFMDSAFGEVSEVTIIIKPPFFSVTAVRHRTHSLSRQQQTGEEEEEEGGLACHSICRHWFV